MVVEYDEVGLRGVCPRTGLWCALCQEDHQWARVLACMGAELLDYPIFVGLGAKANLSR